MSGVKVETRLELMKVHDVVRCNDCPMADVSGWASIKCRAAEGREALQVQDDGIAPPQWCPIREAPVILRVRGTN